MLSYCVCSAGDHTIVERTGKRVHSVLSKRQGSKSTGFSLAHSSTSSVESREIAH